MRLSQIRKPLIMASLSLALLIPGAVAQEETLKTIKVGAAEKAAAASAVHHAIHPYSRPTANRSAVLAAGKAFASKSSASKIPAIPAPGFYPGDISNPQGGPTVQSAQSHGIYLNCKPNCWGTPSHFLKDLNDSELIHIVDPYVGAYGNHRYEVGGGALATGTAPQYLQDADMIGLAYAGASLYGAGYNHVYHIFLPPGQDVCIDATDCYSPDNNSLFTFCAYHSSVDTDIGHIIYTVEPYMNVPGCQVLAPSPNGLVVDSTANVLSHEFIESITDPDGDAWGNYFSLALYGSEIGDECDDFDFGYGAVLIGHRKYEIQPEYSNALHGCAYKPSGFEWPDSDH